MENIIQVSLNVKHHDPAKAREEVMRRLNEWFTDPILNRCEPGYGYPDKTLLHYTIQSVHSIERR
jgi:hypothetical protein